jgi:NAD(P)-dependent dehydrogenase (short-subunit alcohol dehydrogenase family)
LAVSLKNKVVVITGASSGIGRACALAFAKQGSHIVIAARRADKLEAVKREVESLGVKCLAVPTDVSDRAQVERLLDATLEHFGQADIWINNAGYGLAASVELTSPEEMRRIWEVNYMGAFHGCQVALRQMRRQGRGHIMNVSSLAGRFSMPLGAAYSATKAAMDALSEALDLEMAGTGIRVSTLQVSFTETDFFDAMIKKIPDGPSDGGPVATPESVAARIVKCAKRPQAVVVFLPLPRVILAFTDLFPGFYPRLALWYIRKRTRGQGTPEPPGEES